jgi:hypothetical protein
MARVRFPGEASDLSLLQCLGHTQHFIEWVLAVIFLGAKWQERKIYHSLPSSVKDKNCIHGLVLN